jgi:membrane protein YdbS with pleckstrin-like domain
VILREPAEALDPRIRLVWAVEGAITALVVAAAVAVAVLVLALAGAERAAWIVAAAGSALALATAGLLSFFLPPLHHRTYRYEVTDLGLYVARGWLWRRWQIVPHARVQTVDIKSGPLLRAFGLVAVHVATAAAEGGTTIPGLAQPAADTLSAELALRAGIEEGT